MLTFLRPLVSAGVLAIGLVSVGCQSSGGAAEYPQATATSQAVACPKCETTWVKQPTKDQKGRVVGYSTGQKMVCPDCTSAAKSFFSTGKLKHQCATCGTEMQRCEVHPNM